MNESKMPDRVWLCWFSKDGIYDAVDYNENGYPHEYIRADLVPKWIDVKHELPIANKFCTIAVIDTRDNQKFVTNGYFHKDYGNLTSHGWRDDDGKPVREYITVTHWRERPEYPTEGI